MSKYKKPKVGFLDHVAGKTGKETNPIDDVLNEARENPAPSPEPKVEKKPVITEEKKPTSSSGAMNSYVKATKSDPNSPKGAFNEKSVEGYVPPVLEEKKLETDPKKMTAYQKAVKERAENDKRKLQEAADLLGGEVEKPVTQADLKQIKVSLASLGGGGLGEKDVLKLIKDNTGVNLTDSDKLEIINNLKPLLPSSTDSIPEGVINLYYTEARDDSNWAYNWSLKTTDDLPEGSINLYFTEERARQSIQSIDSALIYDAVTGNLSINSNHPDFDHYNSSDFDSDFNTKTTTDLTEGSNLYYTTARHDSDTLAQVDSAYINARIETQILNNTDSLAEGDVNLYYTTARHDSDTLAQVDSAYVNARVETQILHSTDSLPEGSVNLYYTDSRAREAIQSIDSSLIYDNTTGNLSLAIDPDDFYTSREFDSDFALKTTDSLAEGVENLYYTDSRSRAAIQSIDSSLIYDEATGNLSLAIDPNEFYTSADFDSDFLLKTTDSLAEGDSNFYFREERVQHTYYYVKATEGISRGDVIMFAGAQGSHLLVAKADMSAPGFKPEWVMGIARDDALLNDFLYVVAFGSVQHIDVTGFSDGDMIYLDPTTPGGWVNTQPSVPNHVILVASVTDDQPSTNGAIQVRLTHKPDTDEVPEGLNNLYWTDARFDSLAAPILSRLDSVDGRLDSDSIEIQTLHNRIDALDLNSSMSLQYDKILSFDSTTDSVPRGEYGIHFDGAGTSYLNVDKFYFNCFDKKDVFVPYSLTDSNDVIVITDSDGGIARYQVTGTADFGNHFRIDVQNVAGKGAPADLISVKLFPAVDTLDLAPYSYVDAQDKVLQDQIDALDSALTVEHQWNVTEHANLDSSLSAKIDSNHDFIINEINALELDLSNEIDSEHLWNVAEHAALDSNLSARLDSEHAWNVAEHDALVSSIDSQLDSERAWNVSEHSKLDSKIDSEHLWNVAEHQDLQDQIDAIDSGFVNITGDTMTGTLNIDSASLNVNYGNITAKGGTIRAVDGGQVSSNKITSVGNSNISISRNNERRFLIGTNSLIADRKIKYNSGYNRDSYTSDLAGTDSYTLMPKWYIDDVTSTDYVEVAGDTMTGDLVMDSGANLTVQNGGDVRVFNNGSVVSNNLKSVGNSNLQLYRNNDRKLFIGTSETIADQKIRYNSGYNRDSYTSAGDDYTLMPKWYIDSAIANASFSVDSDLFVSTSGDTMTGQLTIERPEGSIALKINKDDQDRIRVRSNGLINWTGNATDARLNKDGGDFTISVNNDTYMKFDLSQGDIEVAKTLTLTAPDKAINLPNNSDIGELQSNSNRRLYWGQNSVGIDVPLELNADTALKIIPEDAESQTITFFKNKTVADGANTSTIDLKLVGNTSYNRFRIMGGSNQSTRMVEFRAGGTIEFNRDFTMNGHRITTLADPQSDQQAANKRYVDNYAWSRDSSDARFLRLGYASNTATNNTRLYFSSGNFGIYGVEGASDTSTVMFVRGSNHGSTGTAFRIKANGSVQAGYDADHPFMATEDNEVITKAYFDANVGSGGSGSYILNGGTTTLTGHTKILGTSSKYLNFQAAQGVTDGFMVMRNSSGNNIFHVSNTGRIKAQSGRMADHDDEFTTKRYVDSRSSSAKTWPGRRFKFAGGTSTSVGIGQFGYGGSYELYLSVQDWDGMRMNEGGTDFTPGTDLTLCIYQLSSNTWRRVGLAVYGSLKTDFRSDYWRFKIPSNGWRLGSNSGWSTGTIYAITCGEW